MPRSATKLVPQGSSATNPVLRMNSAWGGVGGRLARMATVIFAKTRVFGAWISSLLVCIRKYIASGQSRASKKEKLCPRTAGKCERKLQLLPGSLGHLRQFHNFQFLEIADSIKLFQEVGVLGGRRQNPMRPQCRNNKTLSRSITIG